MSATKRTCGWCGKPIGHLKTQARYCGNTCRMAAKRAADRESHRNAKAQRAAAEAESRLRRVYVDKLIDTALAADRSGYTDTRNEPWMNNGLCVPIGGPTWDSIGQHEQVRVCRRCPVVADCHDYAKRVEAGGGEVFAGTRWADGHPIAGIPTRVRPWKDTDQ